MDVIDPVESSLRRALTQRREIEFRFGGAPTTVRPHILYRNDDGIIVIAGMMGDGIVIPNIPISQMKDLIVTARLFQPDPTFDFGDPRYHDALAIVAGV